MVARSMEDGAFGIASALIYPPNTYASTEELIEASKAMAPYGGVYITHMRSEGDKFLEAIDEALQLTQQVFGTPDYLVETTPDIAGVELAAALKNAFAMSFGMVDGAEQVSRSRRDARRVHLRAPAHVRDDAPAELGHAVHFGLHDVIAGAQAVVGEDIDGHD